MNKHSWSWWLALPLAAALFCGVGCGGSDSSSGDDDDDSDASEGGSDGGGPAGTEGEGTGGGPIDCAEGLQCLDASGQGGYACVDPAAANGIPADAPVCDQQTPCAAGSDCWVTEQGAGTGACLVYCGTGGAVEGEGNLCAAGCAKLTQCQLCLKDANQQCYSEADCGTICQQQAEGLAVASCLNAVPGCDQTGLTQCFGGSGGGGGGGECDGCVWDGSACMWYSQGDWGSGPNNPYSGAAIECNSACCQ